MALGGTDEPSRRIGGDADAIVLEPPAPGVWRWACFWTDAKRRCQCKELDHDMQRLYLSLLTSPLCWRGQARTAILQPSCSSCRCWKGGANCIVVGLMLTASISMEKLTTYNTAQNPYLPFQAGSSWPHFGWDLVLREKAQLFVQLRESVGRWA